MWVGKIKLGKKQREAGRGGPCPLPWPQKWATLTWAHGGAHTLGPHADMSNQSIGSLSSFRPFLGGKDGEAGEKLPPSPTEGGQPEQALLWWPRQALSLPRDQASGDWPSLSEPRHATRVLQGALAGVVAHAAHTGAPIGTGVPHTVIRGFTPQVGPSKSGRSTCGEQREGGWTPCARVAV